MEAFKEENVYTRVRREVETQTDCKKQNFLPTDILALLEVIERLYDYTRDGALLKTRAQSSWAMVMESLEKVTKKFPYPSDDPSKKPATCQCRIEDLSDPDLGIISVDCLLHGPRKEKENFSKKIDALLAENLNLKQRMKLIHSLIELLIKE